MQFICVENILRGAQAPLSNGEGKSGVGPTHNLSANFNEILSLCRIHLRQQHRFFII